MKVQKHAYSNTSLKDIVNFNTAALVQAICLRVKGMKKGTSKSDFCMSMSKKSTPILLHAAFAMSRISELMTGENILEAIEKRHLLVNIIELSFSLLFLLEAVNSKLGYHHLLVNNA